MTPLETTVIAMLMWLGLPSQMEISLRYEPVHPAQAVDAWFAEDKIKHLITSTAVVGFAHAGARFAVDDEAALIAAISAGVTAGLLKEFYDRRSGGPFSARDLVWDALGVGIGALIASKAR